jgi:hypothetical protein
VAIAAGVVAEAIEHADENATMLPRARRRSRIREMS